MIQFPDTHSIAERTQHHDQIMSELSQLQAENEALRAEVEGLRVYRRLAYRDPLTGLRNRRYLDERMHEEMQRARRHANPTFSVLLLVSLLALRPTWLRSLFYLLPAALIVSLLI